MPVEIDGSVAGAGRVDFNKCTVELARELHGEHIDRHSGGDLRWTDSRTLRIEYLKAKALLNVRSTATVDGQQIQILLESGVEDPNAPAGGMLFNLRKHTH